MAANLQRRIYIASNTFSKGTESKFASCFREVIAITLAYVIGSVVVGENKGIASTSALMIPYLFYLFMIGNRSYAGIVHDLGHCEVNKFVSRVQVKEGRDVNTGCCGVFSITVVKDVRGHSDSKSCDLEEKYLQDHYDYRDYVDTYEGVSRVSASSFMAAIKCLQLVNMVNIKTIIVIIIICNVHCVHHASIVAGSVVTLRMKTWGQLCCGISSRMRSLML